jgi:hypothetical protein
MTLDPFQPQNADDVERLKGIRTPFTISSNW